MGAPFDRLFALEQFGVKLGLDNIRTLVEALDHPEHAWPCVLVGGTNGKGSVTAMVERALRAAGHRTGRYTSPHLIRLNERFAVDGVPVETGALEAVVDRVLDVEAACRADGRLAAPATFFEVTTACAFELFRQAGVGVAVLEVGLGGRFDATNVVRPVVTAIVSVDVDHTAQLGDTLEAIAFEKAGIARPGVPLVAGDLPAGALAVVERVCAERGAPLVHAAEGVECLVAAGERGSRTVRIDTQTRTYGPVDLGLPGDHQIGNALVALRILEAVDAAGLQVDASAVETGLRDVRWPGRLQQVAVGPDRSLLLDAAHNPAGARALASYLLERWPEGAALVFGASRDKDARGMLDALAPALCAVVVTEFPGGRSRPAAELAAIAAARLRVPVEAAPSPREALARAFTHASRVVVAGSIFLVGAVLADLPEA